MSSLRNFSDYVQIYTPEQYQQLIVATISSSSISLVCSVITTAAFLYLSFTNPKKYNRISLRCVICASLMILFYAVFDILSTTINGYTARCKAYIILTMFAMVTSSSFLTLVGVNLVIVFVLGVEKSASYLERIYYPCVVGYGLISIVVPIYEVATDDMLDDEYKCYFHANFYQVSGYSSLLWMSFYAFLLFSVVVASSCSLAATLKLMTDHHLLLGKFISIARKSDSSEVTKQSVGELMKRQSSILLRVVSRCVLYPLVPLVCNICGFVFQLLLVNPNYRESPAFALAMFDTILSHLQGFFVVIIFFSDPCITESIRDSWKQWRQKYVDEFSQVQTDGHHIHSKGFTTPEADMRRPSQLTAVYTSNKNSISSDEICFIPMRRVSVTPSIYSRINHAQYCEIKSPERTYRNSLRYADPEYKNQMLIPYAHPRFASTVHWILVHLGFKSKKAYETNY